MDFIALGPGYPVLVGDVRLEDQVAVGDVVGRVDHVAPVGRDVAVQILRERLVEVRDHRILLGRVEVLRLVEHALERNAVGAHPVHQLHGAPVEVLLLRIGVGDPAELGERRTHPEVGKLDEGAAGYHPDVGLLGLERRAEGGVGHHDLLGRLAPAQLVAVEAAGLGLLVDGAKQQRLGGIDRVAHHVAAEEPPAPPPAPAPPRPRRT